MGTQFVRVALPPSPPQAAVQVAGVLINGIAEVAAVVAYWVQVHR